MLGSCRTPERVKVNINSCQDQRTESSLKPGKISRYFVILICVLSYSVFWSNVGKKFQFKFIINKHLCYTLIGIEEKLF